MRKATRADKERVVKIICESFDKNPHINFIAKNDKKREMRIANLAAYAFELGLRRDGVILTDNSNGVAIIYQQKKVKMNLYEFWLQLGLAIKTITIPRVLQVSRLESKVKKLRLNEDYLYFWFYGVAYEALGTSTGKDLMKYVFSISDRMNMPICLETTVERNNTIYKRFGLQDYNVFRTEIKDLTFWFMKRPANTVV